MRYTLLLLLLKQASKISILGCRCLQGLWFAEENGTGGAGCPRPEQGERLSLISLEAGFKKSFLDCAAHPLIGRFKPGKDHCQDEGERGLSGLVIIAPGNAGSASILDQCLQLNKCLRNLSPSALRSLD